MARERGLLEDGLSVLDSDEGEPLKSDSESVQSVSDRHVGPDESLTRDNITYDSDLSDSDESVHFITEVSQVQKYCTITFPEETPENQVYSVSTLYTLIPRTAEYDALRKRLGVKAQGRYDPTMSNNKFERAWIRAHKNFSGLKEIRKTVVFVKDGLPNNQGSVTRRIRNPPYGGKPIRKRTPRERELIREKRRSRSIGNPVRDTRVRKVTHAPPRVARMLHRRAAKIPKVNWGMFEPLRVQLDREILSRAPRAQFTLGE